MWVAAAAAAVVAGLVVLLAAFREPDGRVPPSRHGTVTPDELRRATFPLTWRGYSPGHVDALLARAAASLEEARQHAPSEVSEGTLPAFLQDTFDEDPALGEELQDGGGDGAGGLDR